MNSNSACTCLNNQETARKCCWLLVFNIECRGGVTLEKFLSWTENIKGAWEWQMLATPPSSFGVCIVTTLRLPSTYLLEVTSPYPCKDLNFSQTCSFFPKNKTTPTCQMSLPRRTDGRIKIAPNKENNIQFQQTAAYFSSEKGGEENILNALFHNTTDLNCSWPCLLLRSPWISVWQRFWQS